MPVEAEQQGGLVTHIFDTEAKDNVQRESTTEDYFNLMSSPAIVFNNPSLEYRASTMNGGGVDFNDPTFKSLWNTADGETKKALASARSLDHAIAIAGRRAVFADSASAIEQDPLMVQIGMGLLPSVVNFSSLVPVGALGAVAKVGKQVNRVRNIGVGAAYGAAVGAGVNIADEAMMEAQGIQHDYLAAGVVGLGLGGVLGGLGGALVGPYGKTHAEAMSAEGDTFTRDFQSDPNIEVKVQPDGTIKIVGIDDVGRMSKFGLDYIPYFGKFFRSDVHTVYQDNSSVLRSEVSKWANPTVSIKDSKGNVVPSRWTAQNEKSLVYGLRNTNKVEVETLYGKAREEGYKGSYDSFVEEVSAAYTKASARQEVQVQQQLAVHRDEIYNKYKEEKAKRLEEINTKDAYYNTPDGKSHPITEDVLDSINPQDVYFKQRYTKQERKKLREEIELEYREKIEQELLDIRNKLYEEIEPVVEGTKHIVEGVKSFRTLYESILSKGKEARLGELDKVSNKRMYRPRTWNYDDIHKGLIPEEEVKARLTKAIETHPAQAHYTKEEVEYTVDTIFTDLKQRGFDIDNLTTTFVVPEKVPFEGMLRNRKWRLNEEHLGPLLKDNLDMLSDAYTYKMSGRVAMGKVTEGVEWGEYMKDFEQKLIDEGEYSPEALKAFARVVEDTVGTLRMHEDAGSPRWTWTRNLMSYNSLRLGGGFGGNQFIELGANVAMNGIRSLINGRFMATFKNAGKMLYKHGDVDDIFTKSVIASGFMDSALHTHRVNRFSDAELGLNPGLFEKKLFGMQDALMKINGMRLFTAAMEDYAAGSVMTQLDILASKTKLSKSETARLARWGMTHEDAKAFKKDLDKYYDPKEGRFELDKFSDENQYKFQLAVQNGVSEMVIQGDSIHAPNWMKTAQPFLKLMTQFMRFPLIAQEVLLRRGFTEDQARFVGGIIASTVIYMGLKYTREQASIAAGFTNEIDAKYDYFGPFSEESVRRGVLESFNYNANLGFMSSLWNYGALATGNPDLGKDYMYDKGVGALAGPTGGLVDDLFKLTTSAANGEFGTDKDMMILKSWTPFVGLPILSEGSRHFIKDN